MEASVVELIRQIHASPGRFVVAVAGGGSRAIAELLEVPGASRTLLEAVVPYCEPAMIAWLGARPDQCCSLATARAMAMAAFRRAWQYDAASTPAGIACTAALATDRPRRGAHRAHLALQTAAMTATWSLRLEKGPRTRAEEEAIVAHLLLGVMAEACEIPRQLPLELLDGEQVETSRTMAPRPWQDLLLGGIERVCRGNPSSSVIFSGAFAPLHVGHRRMVQLAQDILGVPVALEISILNVDKPPLDYFEIERRLGQFPAEQTVWLTRAATFEEKSRLFPGATFVVGADTMRRIADPRFYGDSTAACLAALERIADRGCGFLVFVRDLGTGLVRLGDLDLPESLRRICREVPAEVFREDVSSTALRRAGEW